MTSSIIGDNGDNAEPHAMRAHAEAFLVEDETLAAARDRGHELGATPIGPGSGAMLQFLAKALSARGVVEVGTGAGASGLWLLRGMNPEGVLTSIDVEPEHQRMARQAFLDAHFPPSRFRLIMGQGLEVLPRLTYGAYDLVFIDAVHADYPRYLEQGVPLLRPGGVIAFDNVLAGAGSVEAPRRDATGTALREVIALVRDDPKLVPTLLPIGDGLLAAVRDDAETAGSAEA